MIFLVLVVFLIFMFLCYTLGISKRPTSSGPRPQRHRRPKPRMDVDKVSSHRETADVTELDSRTNGSTSQPILFYDRDKPYYEFTNFSPYPISYGGHDYPTAEHLFQAHKFFPENPSLAERIRLLPNPRAALEEATRLTRLRRQDWFEVNLGIMDTILEAKFEQHPSLRNLLLDTGDRIIIEASPVDAFWGAGEDGKGRNELGEALMRLRDKLRRQTGGEDRDKKATTRDAEPARRSE